MYDNGCGSVRIWNILPDFPLDDVLLLSSSLRLYSGGIA